MDPPEGSRPNERICQRRVALSLSETVWTLFFLLVFWRAYLENQLSLVVGFTTEYLFHYNSLSLGLVPPSTFLPTPNSSIKNSISKLPLILSDP